MNQTRFTYRDVPISKAGAFANKVAKLRHLFAKVRNAVTEAVQTCLAPLPTTKSVQTALNPGDSGYAEASPVFDPMAYQGEVQWISVLHAGNSPAPVARYSLVAFTGLATCGKTTAAHALVSKGFVRVAFADPLKEMVGVLTEEKDKTACPEELCGRSVREAYQLLGTEWGRNMMGEDIWLRAARRRITAHLRDVAAGLAAGVVIDDCRFDNEAELVRSLGGIVIRVERPGLVQMSHASEVGVDDMLVNYTLRNDDTLQSLLDKVAALVYDPSPTQE